MRRRKGIDRGGDVVKMEIVRVFGSCKFGVGGQVVARFPGVLDLALDLGLAF